MHPQVLGKQASTTSAREGAHLLLRQEFDLEDEEVCSDVEATYQHRFFRSWILSEWPPARDWQLRQIGVTNRLWYRAPQVVEEVQYEGHTRRSLGRLCRNREHGYVLAVRRPAAQ